MEARLSDHLLKAVQSKKGDKKEAGVIGNDWEYLMGNDGLRSFEFELRRKN